MRNTKQEIQEKIEEPEEQILLLGGDFNARIGNKRREKDGENTRKSKDKVENKDGKLLWELIEERGWEVLNGMKEGDEEGKFTWIGKRAESVIDYVIVNGLAEEEVETFKIGERVDSDHMPLEVKVRGISRGSGCVRNEVGKEKKIWWKKHFMKLLNGKEERIVVQDSKTGIGGREREAEIRVEEVGKQVGRLKRGKAPRRDGLSKLMNDVWTGKGFPREWRVGQICPIHKKGSKEKVENYRGITLLNTAYKLYAMVLNESLVTEMNEKSILPESQARFRRGKGAMDNVYILHHLIEKELLKEGGRVHALSVDLKAAFDTVDRECLRECMERRGLSEKLIVAAREIYRETVTRVRVRGIESEMFWTTKGLRQGCPLSPSLFVCYISDIEEMFRGVQAGGIVVRRGKIWGWKEYAEIEAVQEKYLRWMLGLRKETPGYIVREECKREKLRIYTGKRAVKYDERLKEREECRILYECWKEKKSKQGKNIIKVDKDIMKDWDTHGWK
ncbi:uncharacterized protein LOC135128890 [Zophobas morio]|uniref:uncharacterized protein LOC135128890 n=1 Tax=Zophobas morio TaxID=2755281 RepID=UPI003083CCC8